ncbi:MAG TPA: hypothetical protein VIU38_01880 [Anaerolineales bacterium]
MSPPRNTTFWIAIGLAVVGVLVTFLPGTGLSGSAVWLVVVGFVVLAAGNLFEGL